jgi:hypothetical protein
MSTKSYTFTPYHVQNHKIQSWKKGFFPSAQRIHQSFEGQKTIFLSRYRLRDFKFLFLGQLGTYQQNLIPTRHMEPWEKHHFVQRGMLKFTYKDCFRTMKKAYGKFLYWKSKRCAHALVPPLHIEAFVFEKNQNLNFWWNFKVSWTNCLWANFGSFGQF